MFKNLNSARALLNAKNYDGARRIVKQALEDNPEDVIAWQFRIEIETKAENHKEALKLTRMILAKHPDNVRLRYIEFDALAVLRKKREAKKIRDRFAQDFPHHTPIIEQMDIVLDALRGRTKKIKQAFDAHAFEEMGDYGKRQSGIFRHRINDLFYAQRLMLEAHGTYPNDHELNEALAVNSFRICRPATCRKFARFALASAPENKRMRYLITASYLLYFPPTTILFAIIMMYQIAANYIGSFLSFILALAALWYTIDLRDIWLDILSVATSIPFYRMGGFNTLAMSLFYFVLVDEKWFNRIFARKKNVRLKKY